jgi:hypothetical protein
MDVETQGALLALGLEISQLGFRLCRDAKLFADNGVALADARGSWVLE